MMVRFIIEVLGKPAVIVEQTLKKVVESLGNRFKVLRADYSEPELFDESSILSAFVEVELKVKGFEELFSAVLDYGPTVVEILESSDLKVSSRELQASLSDMISKIHSMSKTMQALSLENMKLKNNSNVTKK